MQLGACSLWKAFSVLCLASEASLPQGSTARLVLFALEIIVSIAADKPS